MESSAFEIACRKGYDTMRGQKGIGTLGEKTLHAVLKYYYEPDEMYHEIRTEGYVADISYGNEVIEIQTRNFNKLRNKLEVFLKRGIVTIVYPVAYEKWIQWIDEPSGEMTNKRKSPKKGTPYEAFYELYKIKQYLNHPNLRISIILVNIEEQRLLNGWSEDKKRGASRYERIPVKLIEEVNLLSVEDYKKLIPEGLEVPFSTKTYKEKSKLSISSARTAIHVLHHVGVIKKVGKKGNLVLYTYAD